MQADPSTMDMDKTNSSKPVRRKVLRTALLILALLAIGSLCYWYFRLTRQVSNCTDDHNLLAKISFELQPSNNDRMKAADELIQNKIKTKTDFMEDYNCVYPAAVTSLYFSELSKAAEYLTKLQQLEDKGQRLNEVYSYRQSVEELKKQLSLQQGIFTNIGPSYDMSNGSLPPPPVAEEGSR